MAMTAEEKFTFWLEKAQYDLDSADAMFDSGRWFYVIFACQQALEKLIRAEGVHTHWRYALLAHRLCGGIRVCAPECNFSGRTTYPGRSAAGLLIKGLYILYIDDNVPRIHNIQEVYQWLLTLKP